jgi:hypothetical protein
VNQFKKVNAHPIASNLQNLKDKFLRFGSKKKIKEEEIVEDQMGEDKVTSSEHSAGDQEDEDDMSDREDTHRSRCYYEWAIEPEEPKRIAYAGFISIFLFFTVILTPLGMAFEPEEDNLLLYYEIITDIVFIFDILINFRFAYIDDNYNIETRKGKIAKYYLKSWFILDLLCVCPLEFLVKRIGVGHETIRTSKTVVIARMLRFIKLIKERKNLQRFVKSFISLSYKVEIIWFFSLASILLIHLFSCLWIFVARVNQNEGHINWIDSKEFSEDSNINLYFSSTYFVITTITTVGYGDISGFSTIERLFCILMMISGVISFSFATGSLSSILS